MPGSDPVPIPVAAVRLKPRRGHRDHHRTPRRPGDARGPGPYDANLLPAAAKDIHDRGAREPSGPG